MSLQKTSTEPEFIETPVKNSKGLAKSVSTKAYKAAVENHSTLYTLWLLVVKHKLALLALGNIILVLNWALPEWFSMVLGLFGK